MAPSSTRRGKARSSITQPTTEQVAESALQVLAEQGQQQQPYPIPPTTYRGTEYSDPPPPPAPAPLSPPSLPLPPPISSLPPSTPLTRLHLDQLQSHIDQWGRLLESKLDGVQTALRTLARHQVDLGKELKVLGDEVGGIAGDIHLLNRNRKSAGGHSNEQEDDLINVIDRLTGSSGDLTSLPAHERSGLPHNHEHQPPHHPTNQPENQLDPQLDQHRQQQQQQQLDEHEPLPSLLEDHDLPRGTSTPAHSHAQNPSFRYNTSIQHTPQKPHSNGHGIANSNNNSTGSPGALGAGPSYRSPSTTPAQQTSTENSTSTQPQNPSFSSLRIPHADLPSTPMSKPTLDPSLTTSSSTPNNPDDTKPPTPLDENKTIPRANSAQEAILQWYLPDPSIGLPLALKDWPLSWYKKNPTAASYSQRRRLAQGYVLANGGGGGLGGAGAGAGENPAFGNGNDLNAGDGVIGQDGSGAGPGSGSGSLGIDPEAINNWGNYSEEGMRNFQNRYGSAYREAYNKVQGELKVFGVVKPRQARKRKVEEMGEGDGEEKYEIGGVGGSSRRGGSRRGKNESERMMQTRMGSPPPLQQQQGHQYASYDQQSHHQQQQHHQHDQDVLMVNGDDSIPHNQHLHQHLQQRHHNNQSHDQQTLQDAEGEEGGEMARRDHGDREGGEGAVEQNVEMQI